MWLDDSLNLWCQKDVWVVFCVSDVDQYPAVSVGDVESVVDV